MHAAVAKPAGVLLLFHGCQHGAIDWWPMQPTCPSCIGAATRYAPKDKCLSAGHVVCMPSAVHQLKNLDGLLPQEQMTNSHTKHSNTATVQRVVSNPQQRNEPTSEAAWVFHRVLRRLADVRCCCMQGCPRKCASRGQQQRTTWWQLLSRAGTAWPTAAGMPPGLLSNAQRSSRCSHKQQPHRIQASQHSASTCKGMA